MVVLCHAVEYIYQFNNIQSHIALSIQAKLFKTIVFTIYLLLNRNYENDERVKKFYKKNLLPLIVTTEIWIILYNIFLCIYNNTSIDIHTVIKEMLFFEKVPLKNIWYMPMIIGIYIVIPYIGILERYKKTFL